MKALISFCLRPRLSVTKPVTAMMMNTLAKPAFVMKILEPFSFQWSPSSTAKVCWPWASVPAPGSVRPNAPTHSPLHSLGRYLAFCSGVPFS